MCSIYRRRSPQSLSQKVSKPIYNNNFFSLLSDNTSTYMSIKYVSKKPVFLFASVSSSVRVPASMVAGQWMGSLLPKATHHIEIGLFRPRLSLAVYFVFCILCFVSMLIRQRRGEMFSPS